MFVHPKHTALTQH